MDSPIPDLFVFMSTASGLELPLDSPLADVWTAAKRDFETTILQPSLSLSLCGGPAPLAGASFVNDQSGSSFSKTKDHKATLRFGEGGSGRNEGRSVTKDRHTTTLPAKEGGDHTHTALLERPASCQTTQHKGLLERPVQQAKPSGNQSSLNQSVNRSVNQSQSRIMNESGFSEHSFLGPSPSVEFFLVHYATPDIIFEPAPEAGTPPSDGDDPGAVLDLLVAPGVLTMRSWRSLLQPAGSELHVRVVRRVRNEFLGGGEKNKPEVVHRHWDRTACRHLVSEWLRRNQDSIDVLDKVGVFVIRESLREFCEVQRPVLYNYVRALVCLGFCVDDDILFLRGEIESGRGTFFRGRSDAVAGRLTFFRGRSSRDDRA